MKTLGGWIFLLVFGPALVFAGLHMLLMVIVAVMPWLILLSTIAGVTAGVTAALILRRRFPPRRNWPELPPEGASVPLNPIRRPRGLRGRGE